MSPPRTHAVPCLTVQRYTTLRQTQAHARVWARQPESCPWLAQQSGTALANYLPSAAQHDPTPLGPANLLPRVQVFTEGRETYALVAVVRANRMAQPAEHIVANMVPAVRRAIKQRKPERFNSPRKQHSELRTALASLSASFSKASLSPETLLPQTSMAVALLRPAAHTVYTLHYGAGACAPLVTGRDGAVTKPSSRAAHFESNTGVHEATYSDLGDAMLVLGSAGLWCALPAGRLIYLPVSLHGCS